MLALAFPDPPPAPAPPGRPLTAEVQAILSLHQHAVSSHDLLFCSPVIRHLIESEIPRLLDLARR